MAASASSIAELLASQAHSVETISRDTHMAAAVRTKPSCARHLYFIFLCFFSWMSHPPRFWGVIACGSSSRYRTLQRPSTGSASHRVTSHPSRAPLPPQRELRAFPQGCRAFERGGVPPLPEGPPRLAHFPPRGVMPGDALPLWSAPTPYVVAQRRDCRGRMQLCQMPQVAMACRPPSKSQRGARGKMCSRANL